jgi:hypothetical protein
MVDIIGIFFGYCDLGQYQMLLSMLLFLLSFVFFFS